MPSYEHTDTSPALRKIGGLRAEPTPAGLPVASTSPARSVRMCEPYETKLVDRVNHQRRVRILHQLPLSVNFTGSFCGFGTNSFGTMNGPIGANVSWFLPITQSEP